MSQQQTKLAIRGDLLDFTADPGFGGTLSSKVRVMTPTIGC